MNHWSTETFDPGVECCPTVHIISWTEILHISIVNNWSTSYHTFLWFTFEVVSVGSADPESLSLLGFARCNSKWDFGNSYCRTDLDCDKENKFNTHLQLTPHRAEDLLIQISQPIRFSLLFLPFAAPEWQMLSANPGTAALPLSLHRVWSRDKFWNFQTHCVRLWLVLITVWIIL